jgi:hypothetical protein
MLTGKTLFAGDTVTDIIASVVKEEPDPPGRDGLVHALSLSCPCCSCR